MCSWRDKYVSVEGHIFFRFGIFKNNNYLIYNAQYTQIQNLFLMVHSMQNKSVISVPIKDIIHHPRALFYDIPIVQGA